MVARIKKFNRYQNEYRKVLRIERFANLAQGKKTKAATTFENAISAMKSQTNSGASCSNASAQTDAVANYNNLKDCATTAAALCDVKLDTADQANVDTCKPLLKKYIDDFTACLQSDCACFQALTNLDSTCENFQALNDDTKDKKDKCVKSSTSGSFGACRAAEREAAYRGPQCGCNCPASSATTVAPTGRNMRRDMLFKNFKKLNL